MDDPLLMRGVQCVRDVNGEILKCLERQGCGWQAPIALRGRTAACPRSNAVLEGLSLEEFHHDEWASLVFTEIVNRADVRVIQRRGGARFPLEALEGLSVMLRRQFLNLPYGLGQKLEGNESAQPSVLGPVHHTHTADAQLLEYPVM